MKIQSKTAIVTGASSGLGAAISKALVNEGAAKVYGIARSESKLNELKSELGSQFIPVVLDVTHHDDIKNWIKHTFTNQFTPDILINNAGIGGFGRIDAMDADQWIGMVDTNLNGTYFITSGIVPLMKVNDNSSHIINIGSIMGITTKSEATAYSASKYAINGFSEALFKELRGDNIKVTCVNPGSIETEFFTKSGIEPGPRMLKSEEVADTIIHIIKTPDNVLINEIVMRPLRP